MSLDGPANNSIVFFNVPVQAGGWAVELAAPRGTGVDAIHIWAFPVGGGNPIFVTSGNTGGARGDVADALGSQFVRSGFTFTFAGLPRGAYDLVVYAHSTVTGTFNNVKFVRITVQ